MLREILEETGMRCETVALVGLYDSAIWSPRRSLQTCAVTFLCRPLGDSAAPIAADPRETSEVGWFAEDEIPLQMHPGHRERLTHAYQSWRGERRKAYFDP
jgi:NADH pyrophosphatase NudC (nudix superfamily)